MAKPTKFRDRWRIRWLDENGRRQSECYADRREAALALKRIEANVAEIRAGRRNAPPPERSFGELCDRWIEARVPLKRSGKDDESIIRCHLRPAFGSLSLREVGVAQADAFAGARQHLDKKTVANLLTLLVAMLNYACDLEWIEKVPRIRKPRVRLINADYQWLRTRDEIDRFLRAGADEGPLVHVLYATAIYTGARQGELAALEWCDVDFERRLITIQRSFEGPTKAEDVRHAPIVDALLPLLREWRLRSPGRLLFPNREGRMHLPSSRVFQETLQRVLARAGFARITRGSKSRPYVRFHDLRHTFASHWVANGGDLFKLQKVLGHKSVQMTLRYAHLQPDAFTGDYARFGGAPATAGVVVPLRRAEG